MLSQSNELRKIMANMKTGKNKRTKPTLSSVKENRKFQRVIAITSGKGGVGKTNVSINLSIAMAKYNKNVVLLDADLGLANVNVILGKVPEKNIFHVIKGINTMSDVLIDTEYGMRFIAGASGFTQLANLNEENRINLLNGLNELRDSDIIVLDTGAGISDNVMSFLLAADEVIIVTTPELTSITDAYGTIKAIAGENKGFDLRLIINRVRSVSEAKDVSDRIINIAGQFLNVTVKYIGYIYEDEAIPKSVVEQKPFIVGSPRSKASLCLDHIAKVVLDISDEEFSSKKGIGGFIENIFNYYLGN